MSFIFYTSIHNINQITYIFIISFIYFIINISTHLIPINIIHCSIFHSYTLLNNKATNLEASHNFFALHSHYSSQLITNPILIIHYLSSILILSFYIHYSSHSIPSLYINKLLINNQLFFEKSNIFFTFFGDDFYIDLQILWQYNLT
jgi:hypothetical protein